MNSNKKGHQIITSIVDAIIHLQAQSKYTWTGKSSEKTKKKHAFDELKEIVSLIHATCMQTDPSYSSADCKRDLTYRVLKYSASRWREIQNKQKNKSTFSQDQSNIIMSTRTIPSKEECQSNSGCMDKLLTNDKPIMLASSSDLLHQSNSQSINSLQSYNFDANKMISTLLLPIVTNLQSNAKQN